MAQPRRMLISSFHLTNGTLVSPLLLFYLKLGLVCKKIHRFARNIPKKRFNTIVQSAVNARRQGDENPISSVVAEAIKMLANRSYRCQIKDCSGHAATEFLNGGKKHSSINSKLLKRLNHNTDQLYEIELVKPEIEHREKTIVRFFILNYVKQRMWELHYNFFIKSCDADKYEELEMDTYCL